VTSRSSESPFALREGSTEFIQEPDNCCGVGFEVALRDVVCELVHTRQLPALHIGRQIRIGRRGLVAYLRGMSADGFDGLIKRRVEQGLGDEVRETSFTKRRQ